VALETNEIAIFWIRTDEDLGVALIAIWVLAHIWW